MVGPMRQHGEDSVGRAGWRDESWDLPVPWHREDAWCVLIPSSAGARSRDLQDWSTPPSMIAEPRLAEGLVRHHAIRVLSSSAKTLDIRGAQLGLLREALRTQLC